MKPEMILERAVEIPDVALEPARKRGDDDSPEQRLELRLPARVEAAPSPATRTRRPLAMSGRVSAFMALRASKCGRSSAAG
jgi:hypothetical protein